MAYNNSNSNNNNLTKIKKFIIVDFPNDKIIYEEGTVDTRIIDKKSRLSPEKESKPKGKPKVENPVPR